MRPEAGRKGIKFFLTSASRYKVSTMRKVGEIPLVFPLCQRGRITGWGRMSIADTKPPRANAFCMVRLKKSFLL